MNIAPNKKLLQARIDIKVFDRLDGYLDAIKAKTGDTITKEGVIEFLADYLAELPPKDFLQLYYAYKAKKFSEKKE